MAKKKTKGIFDNDEAQLTAKQWASEGLKKVKTGDLLKQEEAVLIPKTGNMIGFSYNPKKTDGLVKVSFHVQMGFDGANIVHIEMVYSYDVVTDTLITLGANFDGLMFREYKLADILPYIVILSVDDKSPNTANQMQDIMQAYFDEKHKTVGRQYGFLSLAGGILNQAMDKISFGLWHKISIIPKNDLDCSGTCANLISILWSGKSIRRKGQSDYIIISCVTPGDLFNAEGISVVYNYANA